MSFPAPRLSESASESGGGLDQIVGDGGGGGGKGGGGTDSAQDRSSCTCPTYHVTHR